MNIREIYRDLAQKYINRDEGAFPISGLTHFLFESLLVYPNCASYFIPTDATNDVASWINESDMYDDVIFFKKRVFFSNEEHKTAFILFWNGRKGVKIG